MTALQQSIHVALSLGLLEAVRGYDLVDEVVVTRQRGKVLFGGLTALRADFLENDLLAAAVLDVMRVAVSTSKARIKYPLNDYHSNDRNYIRSKRENTSDRSKIIFMASDSLQRPEYLRITP
jgi:hypothetical protein